MPWSHYEIGISDLVEIGFLIINYFQTFYVKYNKDILYKFAKSNYLWERRIAILSTFTFIKRYAFSDAINISRLLLHDEHNLQVQHHR